MRKYKTLGDALSMLTISALLLSLCVIPPVTADSATAPVVMFENTSGGSGSNGASLSVEWTFQASIPVDMTGAKVKEATFSVAQTLTPDADVPDYLDDAQFPNQTEGGPPSAQLCQNGRTSFFTDAATVVEMVGGQMYLTVTFANQCYFGNDLSAPYNNSGSYMDVCDYFTLFARLDGKALGSADLKVAPHDNFHTMSEICDGLDALVDYTAGHTDLYVKQFSMGRDQGDNGPESLGMLYLTVIKDKATVDKWQEIKAEAESDPIALLKKLENGALGDYQVPIMYSNVYANEVAASDGILAFVWMLVETATSESGTIDYGKLTDFTTAGKAELAEQMGPAGEKSSVAIPDLVADDAAYLGHIEGESTDGTTASISTQVELEKYYTIDAMTMDVDELLSDVFFIIVPEENVEDRTYLTRASSGGLDLDRGSSFQTQAETQSMARLIAEWNPVSLTRFHGRMQAFQCEPRDPPYEPNFEYNLLAEHPVGGGGAPDIAVVANNDGHNSYVTPQRGYPIYTGARTANGDGQTQWLDLRDDMSTSYTPQYTMFHNTVSYTVEVPAYNDCVVWGVTYGQLGQSVYIAGHKDGYLTNQTKIFERGMTNVNFNTYELVGRWFCDQHDVEDAKADLFRSEYDREDQNNNFYFGCYIIPMNDVRQSNLQAVTEMIEYLTRNGIQVSLTDQGFIYNGVEYPTGTLIVSMYQAKWSVASGVLYDGTVITGWPALYSEGITAFDKTQGFDMVVYAEPTAYKTISAACDDVLDYEETLDYVASLISSFSGMKDTQVMPMNVPEDSTAAVNTLLKAGEPVSLIIEDQCEDNFLVFYADWRSVVGGYLFSDVSVTNTLAALVIPKVPVVYISDKPADSDKGFVKTTLVSGSYEYNYDRQTIRTLGFAVIDDVSWADLIIGAAALDEQTLAAVKNGTPYIGYGPEAMKSVVSLFGEGMPVRETVSPNAMDVLAYVAYPTDSLITASYVVEDGDPLYGYGAGYLAAILAGAQVLVQLNGSKGPLGGFLPADGEYLDDFLDNSIQAISHQGAGADNAQLDVVLSVNTLTSKTNQRNEYNFIPSAAWATVLNNTGYSDVAPSARCVEAVAAVIGQSLVNGVTSKAFGPDVIITRGILVIVLRHMAGEPATSASAGFANVAADSYCTAVADWVYEVGITSGASSTGFVPDSALAREQVVTLLRNYAEAQGLDASTVANPSGYPGIFVVSTFAQNAITWAMDAGLLTGTGVDILSPQDTATRVELVTLLVRIEALSTTK